MNTTSSGARVYLDNAATSFPKPECVYAAMERYNREFGVAVGRGAYRRSADVQGEVQRCRQRAGRLMNVERPESVVFTFNGTDSLNLAIQGVLRPGDHAISSVIEHNSVIRPLRELERNQGVSISLVPVDSQGVIHPDDIRAALRPNTRLVALTHASNVTGAIQPVAEVGKIAREAGAVYLIDAAQSAGHVPLDVQAFHADLLACPGHKGLLGPLGTGLLYIRPGLEKVLSSLRQGGTGTRSEEEYQPEHMPDKYESGNLNAVGLFGLAASLDWLLNQPTDSGSQHEMELSQQLWDGLKLIPNITLYGPAKAAARVGVVSLSIAGMEPQVVATLLDDMAHVEVRAGLHCAPGTHRALGTFADGGTVRLSVGRFTSPDEIEIAVQALTQIATFG